jgi:hypothetical protein
MITSSIVITVIIVLLILGAILGPILAHRRHAVEGQAQLVAGYDPSMQIVEDEKKTKNAVG